MLMSPINNTFVIRFVKRWFGSVSIIFALATPPGQSAIAIIEYLA